MTAKQYFTDHGISEESIKKFGIKATDKKITIPIKDENGVVLYNKYRHLTGDAKFSYDKGSHATLFNSSVLKDAHTVFIVEGEPDAIRLDQEGLAAVSNTSGASTFKPEWEEWFKDKRIYIVYDTDKAGKEGVSHVQKFLPNALNIELPEKYKDICEYFKEHDKTDFLKLVNEQANVSYDDLIKVIDKWLLIPDKNVIKILLGSLVAHFFETDPLWIFFVAPSSGSKTEIISTITTLPFVHMLSDLTPQTLASGMKVKDEANDPSLLLKLKNNVLVMKDFTTVLSMRFDDRAMIMSQLREVYDGKYSKAFGTGKKVEWEGRLTLICGVTTIIDTQSSLFQVMGERFIMYRIPQSQDDLVAEKALGNYGNEEEMRTELKETMRKYFTSLEIPKVNSIQLPHDILVALANLASFIVKARSGLVRDNYKKELTYIPEPESPARFAKQIGTLIKALAVVDGRNEVNWEDYYLTLRVALDVVPANRMSHFIALCNEPYLLSTPKVASKTNYSTSGAGMILEDLTALQLVKIDRGGGSGSANEWGISEKSYGYFKKMLPASKEDEALYKIFPKNDHYAPFIEEILRGEPAEIVEKDELTKAGFSDADELL